MFRYYCGGEIYISDKISIKINLSYTNIILMAIFLRPPIAAGTFYDIDVTMLRKQLGSCFKVKFKKPKKKVIAAIVPHAGYVYSGSIAAHAYSSLEKNNYLILGTNHSGLGARFALMKKGLWKTPLGEIVIDEGFANKLLSECKLVEYDVMPHENDHSIEVQLPFLQYRFGSDFNFVPLSVLNDIADEDLVESCKIVGKAIGKTIKKEKGRWTVLASSDFSHFIPRLAAEKTDKYLIKSILKLDEREFIERINEKRASVCGYGAIATCISAAKELGAKKAELLKYGTSADVTQEDHSVVGYATIIFY